MHYFIDNIKTYATPTSLPSMRANAYMVYIRRGKKSERTSLTWR